MDERWTVCVSWPKELDTTERCYIDNSKRQGECTVSQDQHGVNVEQDTIRTAHLPQFHPESIPPQYCLILFSSTFPPFTQHLQTFTNDDNKQEANLRSTTKAYQCFRSGGHQYHKVRASLNQQQCPEHSQSSSSVLRWVGTLRTQ